MNRQTLTQCGFVRYRREEDGTTTTSRRVSLEEEEEDDDYDSKDAVNDDDEEDEFQEFTQEFTQKAFNEDDFLEEEEEEEDLSEPTNNEVVDQQLNSPQSKKRRISRQSTLDFSKAENPLYATGKPCFKDTDDIWFVPIGFQMHVFKKNETFIIDVNRGQSHCIEKYLFTITDFAIKHTASKQRDKWGVSQRPLVGTLERTFIGSEEAKRLVNDPTWKQLHPVDSGLVEWHATNILPPDGAYRLRQLRPLHKNEPPFYRSTDIPPEPSLVFEAPSPDMGRSQFTIVYRQKQQGPTRLVKRVLDHHKPVALDLFAGGGGMGIGLAKAGFHVKYAVEINPAAAATLRYNHRDTHVFEEDAKLFLEKAKALDPCYPKPRGDIEHLHASSPCQGFSLANRNGGVNDMTNNELSYLFVDAIRHFMPRTGCLENVMGMLHEPRGNRRYIQKIMADLMLLGYSVRLSILNAANYGDPQSRRRVFLFCARNGVPLPALPTPTHGADNMVTARDALKNLEFVDPVPGSGMVRIQDDSVDGSFRVVTNHNSESTQVKAESTKLKADEPAKTLLRKNGIEHYSLPRGLTIRERARLQSFPDVYEFCGSLAERSNQIGNAVPVNVAHAVAQTLYESHINQLINDSEYDLEPDDWDWYDELCDLPALSS